MRGKQSRKKKTMKTTSQKKSNKLPQESEQSQQPAPQAQATPAAQTIPRDGTSADNNYTGKNVFGFPCPKNSLADVTPLTPRSTWKLNEATEPKPDTRLPIDTEARKKNRTLPTEKVLQMLQTASPDLFRIAEVVGKWVWVTFTEQPAPTVRQTLAQLGFHWNRQRQAWQHPCGQFRLSSAGDPRERYSSSRPADMATT